MLFDFRKLRVGLVLIAGAAGLIAQSPKAEPAAQSGLELPASLETRIVAGSTPVGAEVRARLTIATLVGGVVIPQNAVISGHVEQSVAKTKDDPSLLKIKFESAHWKKGGTAPVNLYLAGCFYPIDFKSFLNNPSGVHGEAGIMTGGAPPDNLPRSNSGMPNMGGMPTTMDASRPNTFPDPRPDTSISEVSTHWVRMEKVDTAAAPDGGLQITSTDRNLKLDKGTIYLLRGAPPAKP